MEFDVVKFCFVKICTPPLKADTDGDGLTDAWELGYATNPLIADTDGDGFNDLFEVNSGFNPTISISTPEGRCGISMVNSGASKSAEFRFNAASGVSYRIEASTNSR